MLEIVYMRTKSTEVKYIVLDDGTVFEETNQEELVKRLEGAKTNNGIEFREGHQVYHVMPKLAIQMVLEKKNSYPDAVNAFKQKYL